MTPLAENIWLLSYPLKVLGFDIRRNVTVIKLASGKLIIHSSAPFTPGEIAEIKAVGEPGWITDVMLRHDTYAVEGHTAFPDIPYLAPPGFAEHVKFPVLSLTPPPAEWMPEIQVLPLRGVPSMRETLFLHVASKTLIVADLAMNFPGNVPFWQEMFLNVSLGSQHTPGIPRILKLAIKDEAAFQASLAALLGWDFDRIVVGHGYPIESGGKEKLQRALGEAGFLH